MRDSHNMPLGRHAPKPPVSTSIFGRLLPYRAQGCLSRQLPFSFVTSKCLNPNSLPHLRVSINGDLEVRTHGTKKYRKNLKKQDELLSLSIRSPHGFSHSPPDPLISTLASTHTTHQIILIRCVQCVELIESVLMCRGSLPDHG